MTRPAEWYKVFPLASGKNQSPVDIQSALAVQDPRLIERPLSWSYVPKNCKSLVNTGEGWKVNVEGQDSCLSGGPLDHSYQLAQFHCHWGKCLEAGSEHTLDGKQFASELHLVHWNVDLYNSVDEALTSPQGLAVLGIFIQIGKHHDELSKITDILHEISDKGSECPLLEAVNPVAFFPEERAYWTYEGSLTTPPCHESVTWIVFKSPVEVSLEQLEKFKVLCTTCTKAYEDDDLTIAKVLENYRPVQPLHDRVIREAPY